MSRKQRTVIYELAQALRLTQEYVGDDTLPRIKGWSWFDALTKHAPEMLERPSPSEYDGGTTLGITEPSE